MLVCSVIADVILMASMLLFCEILFRFKKRDNALECIKLIVTVLCVVGISLCVNMGENLFVEVIVYFLTVFILIYSFYEEKRLTLVVVAVWILVVLEMFDAMLVIFSEIITGIMDTTNTGGMRLFRALLLLMFVSIVGKLYNKRFNRGIKTIGITGLATFTILTIVDTVIVMTIGYILAVDEELKYKVIYLCVFLFVILGLFIQLGAVILLLMQRNIYREAQQITEKYLEEQKGHYQYLEQRELETKKFRHDLRSHMGLLSVLVKEHKYDEFDKYVDKINIKIDSFGNNVTVQNGIVDAIINKYYSEATANDIQMEVKGRFPNDCKIDAYDLCTIFSNVLSNAIEATVESKDRWMSVDCRYTDDNIIVVVKNSFDNTNQLRKGKAKTHKKDINNHGFGLENVKDSIRKYNGMWDIDINENVYSITISFNYDRLEGNYEDSDN